MSGKLHLEIPASTANLGVGFDSIGMALNKFLTLDVAEIEGSEWQFHHFGPHIESLPTDDTHYIYQVAQQVAKRYNVSLPALEIKMHSEIPLARGLGSSAAALVSLIISEILSYLNMSCYNWLLNSKVILIMLRQRSMVD